ncbi:hypothetical protein Naga_100296g5 [Nannochloropsis gaditana]|uniref:Uncharacterized protein n=1 Tax=Nannochloropsis gaditana TaxID=72520 RepID=W7TAV9_9STRA|nr:hypothetical protein Naga_100296g5 [Nannochloropsis gaditana]
MGGRCSRLPDEQINTPQVPRSSRIKEDCPIHGKNGFIARSSSGDNVVDEEDRQSSHARKQDVLQKTRLPLRRAFRSRTTNKISGKAEISLLRPAHLYAAGDVAALQVEVQVPIHKSFEPGTKVFMPDNGYWKESSVSVPDGLSPGDVVTVELLAEPKRSKMTLKDVKADIELRVTGPSVTPGGPEMIILRQYVAFDGIDFAGDLFPIPLSPSLGTAPLLLYILGAEQAGKTTFVESLRNVLASAETDMPPPSDLDSTDHRDHSPRAQCGSDQSSFPGASDGPCDRDPILHGPGSHGRRQSFHGTPLACGAWGAGLRGGRRGGDGACQDGWPSSFDSTAQGAKFQPPGGPDPHGQSRAPGCGGSL